MSHETNIRKFEIYRFNPETDKKPYMQTYELDVKKHECVMVLDAILAIKNTMDCFGKPF